MNNIDIEKACSIFERCVGFQHIIVKNKKSPPHRIMWKGNIVSLRNGKNIWPSIGAAKNAISNKIGYMAKLEMINCVNIKFSSEYKKGDEAYQFILQKLQDEGILKFVPVIIEGE